MCAQFFAFHILSGFDRVIAAMRRPYVCYCWHYVIINCPGGNGESSKGEVIPASENAFSLTMYRLSVFSQTDVSNQGLFDVKQSKTVFDWRLHTCS